MKLLLGMAALACAIGLTVKYDSAYRPVVGSVREIEAVAEYRFELLGRLTQAIGETGEEFRFADFETDEECSMQSMADALAGE